MVRGNIACHIKSEIIMITQFQSFEELTNEASSYLTSLSYSEQSVLRFVTIWQDVYRYMNEHEIQSYDGYVGTQYLLDKSKNAEYRSLSGKEKRRVRAISVLSDFQKDGIIRKERKAVSAVLLDGQIGKLMSDYIAHLKQVSNLQKQTIKHSIGQLSVFLNYLNSREIVSFGPFSVDRD